MLSSARLAVWREALGHAIPELDRKCRFRHCPPENADARAEIADVCDVRDRFSAPRALAHNKFLVICDSAKTPRAVWTGSTNWTKTGLCTQANNGLLIDNAAVASAYLDQWNALAKAGDATPENLRTADETPRTPARTKGFTLWFTPMPEPNDLDQAGKLIAGAKEGILRPAGATPGSRI